MRKKQLIGKKPAYFRGQLLLEDDFIAEQQYQARGRHRHSLNLHGFGIVRGLGVTASGDAAISVSPGYAIDREGHEIEIKQAELLDLASFPAGTVVSIAVGYEEERPEKARDTDRRIDCFGVVFASPGLNDTAILLATVQLDQNGRLMPTSINTANAQRLRTPIAPGSVTVEALDTPLRKGWLRMPFRPIELPQDEKETKPPFRVGATETRAHRNYPGEQPNTRGAGGTMAIPLSPGITKLHRLRIAGAENESKMSVGLYVSGWDPQKMTHAKRDVLNVEIGPGPYDRTYEIADGNIDPECHTLSLEIRSHGYVRVSLVAVELSY
jgi:hypothetical protein